MGLGLGSGSGLGLGLAVGYCRLPSFSRTPTMRSTTCPGVGLPTGVGVRAGVGVGVRAWVGGQGERPRCGDVAEMRPRCGRDAAEQLARDGGR